MVATTDDPLALRLESGGSILSAGLKGPDSMEFLFLIIAVMALALVYGYRERRDLKRDYNEGLAIARHNHAVDLRRIVDRLSLRFIDLPPINNAIYSKVVDLYDAPEFMVYPQRVGWARRVDDTFDADAITYYWNVESANEFYDDELIALWIAAIIRAPLDVKDFE